MTPKIRKKLKRNINVANDDDAKDYYSRMLNLCFYFNVNILSTNIFKTYSDEWVYHREKCHLNLCGEELGEPVGD
jgi:hypothetical protein